MIILALQSPQFWSLTTSRTWITLPNVLEHLSRTPYFMLNRAMRGTTVNVESKRSIPKVFWHFDSFLKNKLSYCNVALSLWSLSLLIKLIIWLVRCATWYKWLTGYPAGIEVQVRARRTVKLCTKIAKTILNTYLWAKDKISLSALLQRIEQKLALLDKFKNVR